MQRYAVYATSYGTRNRTRATFRIGQPTDLNRAHDRHERLAGTGLEFNRGLVKHQRRQYRIAFYEVRAVDDHGRRLDSNRSDEPIHVPYRAHRAR